jgi:hypothetical protein
MANPNQKDIIVYLTETLEAIKKLKSILGTRNKTTKFKAIASMLTIIEARMSAGLNYAKAGGISGLDSTLQEQMYTPIIQWLMDEMVK